MSVHLWLVVPAAAGLTAAADYAPGSGRFNSMVALLLGLSSVVLAVLALVRGAGPRQTTAATVVGLAGALVAGVHLATSSGSVGSGDGRGGAVVALVVGLVGAGLGAHALVRSRRTDRSAA